MVCYVHMNSISSLSVYATEHPMAFFSRHLRMLPVARGYQRNAPPPRLILAIAHHLQTTSIPKPQFEISGSYRVANLI